MSSPNPQKRAFLVGWCWPPGQRFWAEQAWSQCELNVGTPEMYSKFENVEGLLSISSFFEINTGICILTFSGL